MTFKNTVGLVTVSIFILFSCANDPLDISTEGVAVNINFIDVDERMKDLNATNAVEFYEKQKRELGELFIYEVTNNLQAYNDSVIPMMLVDFYNSPYIKTIEKEKSKVFDNKDPYETEINDGFLHLKAHFPEKATPEKILWMNMIFAGIDFSEKDMSIGLEKYLDSTHAIIDDIPSDQMYGWQKEGMSEVYLTRDVIQNWLQKEYFVEIDGTLAEHIIQAGKILYLVEAAFPEKEDNLILRYTPEDIEWATENEGNFWKYLVEQKLLFENNPRDKSNMLNDGPFTIGLDQASPSRMGQFLGWKMVKGYMKQNDKLSLQELLDTDYNTIFQSYEIEQ